MAPKKQRSRYAIDGHDERAQFQFGWTPSAPESPSTSSPSSTLTFSSYPHLLQLIAVYASDPALAALTQCSSDLSQIATRKLYRDLRITHESFRAMIASAAAPEQGHANSHTSQSGPPSSSYLRESLDLVRSVHILDFGPKSVLPTSLCASGLQGGISVVVYPTAGWKLPPREQTWNRQDGYTLRRSRVSQLIIRLPKKCGSVMTSIEVILERLGLDTRSVTLLVPYSRNTLAQPALSVHNTLTDEHKHITIVLLPTILREEGSRGWATLPLSYWVGFIAHLARVANCNPIRIVGLEYSGLSANDFSSMLTAQRLDIELRVPAPAHERLSCVTFAEWLGDQEPDEVFTSGEEAAFWAADRFLLARPDGRPDKPRPIPLTVRPSAATLDVSLYPQISSIIAQFSTSRALSALTRCNADLRRLIIPLLYKDMGVTHQQFAALIALLKQSDGRAPLPRPRWINGPTLPSLRDNLELVRSIHIAEFGPQSSVPTISRSTGLPQGISIVLYPTSDWPAITTATTSRTPRKDPWTKADQYTDIMPPKSKISQLIIRLPKRAEWIISNLDVILNRLGMNTQSITLLYPCPETLAKMANITKESLSRGNRNITIVLLPSSLLEIGRQGWKSCSRQYWSSLAKDLVQTSSRHQVRIVGSEYSGLSNDYVDGLIAAHRTAANISLPLPKNESLSWMSFAEWMDIQESEEVFTVQEERELRSADRWILTRPTKKVQTR